MDQVIYKLTVLFQYYPTSTSKTYHWRRASTPLIVDLSSRFTERECLQRDLFKFLRGGRWLWIDAKIPYLVVIAERQFVNNPAEYSRSERTTADSVAVRIANAAAERQELFRVPYQTANADDFDMQGTTQDERSVNPSLKPKITEGS